MNLSHKSSCTLHATAKVKYQEKDSKIGNTSKVTEIYCLLLSSGDVRVFSWKQLMIKYYFKFQGGI